MKLHLADDFQVDLDRLLASRLLAQARSGGGKSWLLRRLLEQALPYVQCLVIDPEGEFASLREKFDILICAPKGADLEATPRTAATLARRLLETGASAVLDIYDLQRHERELFVQRFCEALINAPKTVWRPALIIVDEAHLFAPEGGKTECGRAVIDLATRGRKHGLGLCLATQRLSKLSKDAAAELGNKLIGGTNLDLDVKRASDEIGKGAKESVTLLRELKPGEFYAYGPAFAPGVTALKVGPVATTHPEPGKRLEAPREPSAKLKRLLSDELKDLPRQAETQAKTEEELRAEVRSLKGKLAVAEKAQPQAPVVKGIPDAKVTAMVEAAEKRGHRIGWDDRAAKGYQLPASVRKHLEATVKDLQGLLGDGLKEYGPEYSKPKIDGSSLIGVQDTVAIPIRMRDVIQSAMPKAKKSDKASLPPSEGITRPQQRLLDALAQLEMFGLPQPSKPTLGAHAKVKAGTGSFGNNLGSLRTLGLIDYPSPGQVSLTEKGQALAHYPDSAPTLEELHGSWLDICTNPQAKLLKVLITEYPKHLTKDDLASRAGVESGTGSFGNNLGRLRTMGAIDYPRPGLVVATTNLFPEVTA